jgi:hypothetical protein
MRVLGTNRIIAGGLVTLVACGGDLAETPDAVPWALNPTVADHLTSHRMRPGFASKVCTQPKGGSPRTRRYRCGPHT